MGGQTNRVSTLAANSLFVLEIAEVMKQSNLSTSSKTRSGNGCLGE